MKTKIKTLIHLPLLWMLPIVLLVSYPMVQAQQIQDQFNEYKGEVRDSQTGDAVSSAFLSLDGSNISTVTNTEGEFSLKIPVRITEGTVTVSNLGYKSKTISLEYFKKENTIIELDENFEELSEISVFTANDAKQLVQTMLSKTGDNYIDDPTLMTAFYREAIKTRWRNVSLAEAVVRIHKKPYTSMGKDDISLVKARKSADYKRLDTLALKLRGGPFNNLYSDVMKYPEYLFRPNELNDYTFSFDEPTRLNNRYLYVVNFEQINKELPWFFGKLFIDAQTSSLVKAVYELNVDNRNVASQMFVRKKPSGARVHPVNVQYEIDYRESDGKWYYGYGSAQLEFVVNWKRKLFNTKYTVNSEMAVTDWERRPEEKVKKDDTFLSQSVVMADDVSGFTDVRFWGENNIIEPDKSIQNAIEKIQRQIERSN
ncbi:carboxypeptidase-like regulatory domain-containing protein [Antarcticibacterium flavum]|uniref:Carboxypeptidase-like regulatory domain-containing protein n=1 Tax=Antarcticibacterium flavum TaxID=2058175 RepID=A0A5B7WZX4_9FLAO|nr:MULTISPECIES: carboxypeptidase-like regulatory domain-containing protein [Antarcticibacterium]MCM4160315.1 hypothetical protein [Antarcticibacterium sp. W02-3]QCY67913.1 carboxypeptidase-like regulatory domain-containing protein [Antarcticibacterium flavum]QCY71306.1 carboxypeptidase-like regulatory domain-containing protein [Antarcticibacterium flavum]